MPKRKPRQNLSSFLFPGSRATRDRAQVTSIQEINTTPVSVNFAAGPVLAQNVVEASLNQYFSASQFKNFWEEYRVLKAAFHVYPVQSTGGLTKVYLDESDTTGPTAQSAATKVGVLLDNNHLSSAVRRGGYVFRWQPQDPKDFDFLKASSISSNANPVCLKFYTDGNYGTTATSGLAFMVEVVLTVEFRGSGGL